MTSERGNILWFLLLAIALLGILTVVMTRSGSNTDEAGDRERRTVKSSELFRYGASIRTAIGNMLQQGVSENEISFEHNGTDLNARCTASNCKIFNTGGAGLNYRTFPDANDGSNWIFTGANNVGTAADPVGTTAAGTGNDLVMLLPNAKSSLCTDINTELGVGTSGTLPADAGGIVTTAFDGAYPSAVLSVLDGDATPFELDGHEAGCFIAGGVTYFYFVVLAR
jgi:hypothetical protein